MNTDRFGGEPKGPPDVKFRSLIETSIDKIREALALVDQSENHLAGAHLQAAVDALSLSLLMRNHVND